MLQPAFPEMVSLRSQINENQKQIRAQIQLIRLSLQSQYESAQRQEKALLQQLDASKRELLDLRGKNVEYAILMREVDTARSLYDGLLQQFREVSVAAEIDTNNVSIIDRAEVPGAPESPSLRRNLMIALMLGLLCAARAQNSETANGLVNLATLPMFILCGVFFSSSRFPGFVQPLIRFLPLSAFNEALRHVVNDGASLASQGAPLLILLA